MIALLTIVTFILPPNASEKIFIGLVDLIILSIYLIYFSILIPPMGDHIPFIGNFGFFLSKISPFTSKTIFKQFRFIPTRLFWSVCRSSWQR